MYTDLFGTESQALTTSKSSFLMRQSNKIRQLWKESLSKEEFVLCTTVSYLSKCLKSMRQAQKRYLRFAVIQTNRLSVSRFLKHLLITRCLRNFSIKQERPKNYFSASTAQAILVLMIKPTPTSTSISLKLKRASHFGN